MEVGEEFAQDWMNKFSDEPLPSLRCLGTFTDSDELLEALTTDEQELVRSRERLQEELDRVEFNLNWITTKKEQVTLANEDNDQYANVDPAVQPSSAGQGYPSSQSKPRPRPRLLTAPLNSVLPRMPPPALPGAGVRRAASMPLRRPVQMNSKVELDSVVSEEQCRILSHSIDKSYKAFGRQIMNFSATEIEMCKKMSNEENKQAMRLLLKWKQRMGHNATVRALTGFLKDFGYGPDIWGFLEDPEKYDPRHSLLHEAERSPDFEPYQAIVVTGYITSTPDELSAKKGDLVTVQDTGRDSWLFVEIGGLRGWVPGNCIGQEPKQTTNGTARFLFVVEATMDSSRLEEESLDFRKNEYLDVLEEVSFHGRAMYMARNRDGLIGLALQRECRRISRTTSILCDREWYHSSISRGQTEEVLRPCPHGAFLVRDASKVPGNFVLCVKKGDEIASLMMTTNKNIYKVYDGEFTSIQNAIDHYRINPIRDRLYLNTPAPKNKYR